MLEFSINGMNIVARDIMDAIERAGIIKDQVAIGNKIIEEDDDEWYKDPVWDSEDK